MLVEKIEPDQTVQNPVEPVIRIAVCGEVSAGKSTVLNALMRARTLPDNIGRTNRPVVVLGHRPEAGGAIDYIDGRRHDFSGQPDSAQFDEASTLRLWSEFGHLSGFEFVEIPMTKAEELTQEQIDLVASCDLLIWVTIASQAWRLTEKTILEHLKEVRPKNAILAVTRADKLRNTNDRTRLGERLFHETSQLFNECVFIHGAPSKLANAAKSEKQWDATGGSELMSMIAGISEGLRARKAEEAASGQMQAQETGQSPAPKASKTEDTEDMVARAVAHLAQATSDMRGILASGLIPHAQKTPPLVVQGTVEEAEALSPLCRNIFQSINGRFSDKESGGLETVQLSLATRRILLLSLPDRGIIYLIADARIMNQGTAQTCLTRLSKDICAQD